MGVGIAQVFLASGRCVSVFEPDVHVRASIRSRLAYDLSSTGKDGSLADRLVISATLQSAVETADFVTEAAPERLALKQALFAELTHRAPPRAILATNTSVIPIHLIANDLPSADRIIGTHWWNPPALIPLVEVVPSAKTSEQTAAVTMELLKSLGKSALRLQKDTPGFIGNRLQHALWREAMTIVAEGICDARTLDECVKTSFGLRLSVLGPLENADLIGLDLTADIHNHLAATYGQEDAHPFLQSLVAAGKLGAKTGQGFLPWTEEKIATVRERLMRHLRDLIEKKANGA